MKDLVISKFGRDKWELVLKELEVEDEASVLIAQKQYEDGVTVAAVEAVAKVLGATWDTALELYGAHFVAYVYEGGFGRMLRNMGDNMQDLLENINHMHQYLERNFRESNFPIWGIEPEGDSSFILSYNSARGLALKAIIKGLLSEAARRLFHQKIEIEELDETRAGYLLTMRVTMAALPQAEEPAARETQDDPQQKKVAALWHEGLKSLGYSGFVGGPHAMDAVVEAEAAAQEKGEDEAGRLYLDTLAKLVRADPQNAAEALMRAVPASAVCADWADAASLDNARDFWETYAGDRRYFSYSKPAPKASRFVSHSWKPPSDWAKVMGEKTSYAEIKAAELTIVAKDMVGSGKHTEAVNGAASWKEVLFWVDKCCMPQKHPILGEYLARLEDFIQRSDGMAVLLSWQYFSRLWCIYEWAVFLVYHSPSNMQLCVDYFLKPATQQRYLRCIAEFSVASAQCDVESDRNILKAKIAQHFVSEVAFETYVKATAVALLARTAARRAGRNKLEYQQEFAPWIDLAGELGFARLAAALRTAKPMAWRVGAMRDGLDCLGEAARAWMETYEAAITDWFEESVIPELDLLWSRCVRKEFLGGGGAEQFLSGGEALSSCRLAEAASDASTACTLAPSGMMVADAAAPKCPSCLRGMQWSNTTVGGYQWGWDCIHKATCGASSDTHGPWRWWCQRCSMDLDQVCAFRGPPPSSSQTPQAPQTSSAQGPEAPLPPRTLLRRMLQPRACTGKRGAVQPEALGGGGR